MAIFDVNGNQIGGNSIILATEHGDMDTTNGQVLNTYSTAETRYRSVLPIVVSGGAKVTVSVLHDASSVSSIKTLEYSSSFTFLQSHTLSNGQITINSSAKYVKFVVAVSASGENPSEILVSANCEIRTIKNFATRATSEHFIYEVSPGIYTSGVLMLPPNYEPDGSPVPLLVYVQGTNGYTTWDAEIGSLAGGSSYLAYMQYLANEGYAIFSAFGWTSKYYSYISGTNANTFGTHICMAAFTTGIEYTLSRYNLDNKQVNLYCKSLGGQIACLMAIQPRINFRTIAMLCPSIDMLHRESLGYNVANRTILAQEWEFEGDVNGVFLKNNFTNRSSSGEAFLSQNKEKLSGFNPGWIFNGRTLSQKFADSIDIDYTHTDMYRDIFYPVKIWGAEDDDNVSYPKIQEYVAQCYNGGHDVALRTMPNGTGGHHSVDTDPNALKSSGTTALGITYTNIPTAYVEMVEFIRSRA